MSVVVALGALPAVAQTNDHLFRSWAWSFEAGGGRSAGLGGSAVALPDDASAAIANPAILATLTKTELVGTLLQHGGGSARPGDTFDARTGVGLAAAAGRLGSRWAAGAYVARTQSERIRIDTPAFADRLRDTGTLEAGANEVGLVAAWSMNARVQLGARAAASRLSLDGEYTREPATGLAPLRVDTDAHETRLAAAAGALVRVAPRLWLGVSAANGVRWNAERSARNAAFGVVLDPGSGYYVVQPALVSAGLSFQPALKLLLTAQLDRVSYHTVQSSLIIGQGAYARNDYALPTAWEPRLGAELSLPSRRFSLQLRAGLHLQASNALLYTGDSPTEQAAFPGVARQGRVSAGASLVTLRWLRFDAAARFGGGRGDVIAGTAVRF